MRSRSSAAEMLLRTEVRRLDPNVALSDVSLLADQLDAARSTPRTSAMLWNGAAATAVFLALVGVYGGLVPLIVLIASVIGWLAPARRALRVDLVGALKHG